MSEALKELYTYKKMLQSATEAELFARMTGFYNWASNDTDTKDLTQLLSGQGKAFITPQINSRSLWQQPNQATNIHDVAAVGMSAAKALSENIESLKEITIALGIRLEPGSGYLTSIYKRYFRHTVDYVGTHLADGKPESQHRSLPQRHPPGVITESLNTFKKAYPEIERNVFIMMQFGNTPLHQALVEAIRETLKKYNLRGLRADDRQFHDDLFPNVQTYIYGCAYGIAVFERLEAEEFNPNVSLEVGYMWGLKKPVCLLKDRTLKTLHTDLAGKLYKEFDPQIPTETIPAVLEAWLRDKEVITL